MADDKKSSGTDEQAQEPQQKDGQIKDLPQQEVSKDGAEQVKGGKAGTMNWDIPAGTASPSA